MAEPKPFSQRLTALQEAAGAMRSSIAERKSRDPKSILRQSEFDAVTKDEEQELAGIEALIATEFPKRVTPEPVPHLEATV